MTDREVWCFVTKFRQLLSAGKTAKLVMDSQQGYARINLEVLFNHHEGHEEQHHHRHQARRAAGPARARRRARRQAQQHARQVAEKQFRTPDVSSSPRNVADPPDLNPPDTAEEAVLLNQYAAEGVPHQEPHHAVGEPA